MRRVPFIAIYPTYRALGHTLMVISRGGEVISKLSHYPWFVSSMKIKDPNIVRVDNINGEMLLLDDSTNIYLPRAKPYKIDVISKRLVPNVARNIIGRNGRAGLFNITYEVRAGFDIQREPQKDGEIYGILGYPSPLAFLPNDEMVEMMEKVIDDVGNIKVMALDIEVYSTHGGFPIKGDPILSITYSTFNLKDNVFDKDWASKNVKYLLNDEVNERGSRRLVQRFTEVINKENPDIIVGFNTSGFDFPYMEPFKRNFDFKPEFVIDTKNNRYYPHVDLMIVRKSLGSSLGLRSQAVFALDDVTIEAIKGNQVQKFHDIGWLFNSRYMEAERKLDHAKLKQYFDNRDQLFFDYIIADVYLTSVLARIWLYPMFLLSVLTGVPITTLQKLNVGQMAEYVLTEVLLRLGFFPELRYRSKNYSRIVVTGELKDVKEFLSGKVRDWWVFEKGKVYVTEPGIYGGGDHRIIELDFAQLYPTDMVANTVDPTSIFITKGYEWDGERVRNITPTLITNGVTPKITTLSTWSLLKVKPKNKEGKMKIELYQTIPGYGPISWFIYKMYTARKETKKMKNLAKKLKRVELLAPDQAVKIYNNSTYGALSKRRGNLVHELASASVFWRTQRLLYNVIRAIETEISEELNTKLKVLYGDTDSSYVLVPKSVPKEQLEELVNKWIHKNYGPLYKMELEGEYSNMIIPKRKGSTDPSAKSYILLDDNGKIMKIKGEFYKINAPLAIKDRLLEFFEGFLSRDITTKGELEKYVKEFLKGEPPYKYFIKKSISTFVNEDDPSKFKNMNKPFHYAALVSLCENRAVGTSEKQRRVVVNNLSRYIRDKYPITRVRCSIDPRLVEETQRAVIVHYLPSPKRDSKKFVLLVREEDDGVLVNEIVVTFFDVIKEQNQNEKSSVDKEIVIEYEIHPRKVEWSVFEKYVLIRIERELINTLYEKLIIPMNKTRNSRGV